MSARGIVAALMRGALAGGIVAASARAQIPADSARLRNIAILLGQDSTKRAALTALLQPADYAVPSSPAFELLPDKPSDVVHLLTPHDFQSNATTWFDGLKLRAGIAVDARPLVTSGGSLPQYQRSWVRRAAFRTVLSVGTAAATSGSSDVIGAVGLRLPLIDHADPRTDERYLEALASGYNRALAALGQPPFNASDSLKKARHDTAVARGLAELRAARAALVWNALRLDLGLAGSASATGGEATRRDSVQSRGGGLWLGLGVPILSNAQLTLAGKGRWARAATDSQETRRVSAGARLLFLAASQLAISGEGSYVRSDHKRLHGIDDRFTHLGVVGEWYVPTLNGWIGIGYGGDVQRSERTGDELSVHYALYSDRILGR